MLSPKVFFSTPIATATPPPEGPGSESIRRKCCYLLLRTPYIVSEAAKSGSRLASPLYTVGLD